MRFLLKVNIPNYAGNAAARAGKLGKTIKAILDEQRPEAVYFTDDRGQGAGTCSSNWPTLRKFLPSPNPGSWRSTPRLNYIR
jgi:hypothetical protein